MGGEFEMGDMWQGVDKGMLMTDGQVEVEEEKELGGGDGLLSPSSSANGACGLPEAGCGGGGASAPKETTCSTSTHDRGFVLRCATAVRI